MHSYERSNPVYNYVNDKCGLVHITIGASRMLPQSRQTHLLLLTLHARTSDKR